MKKINYLIFALLLSVSIINAGVINGKATSSKGQALVGANVMVEGTSIGSATDADGNFSISIKDGNYNIIVSMIGYEKKTSSVNVTGNTTVNFSLKESSLELSGIEVLASRAVENTPVAYTNISKKEMEVRLGSQDIPLILNTTPSVYATQQGGGAGDARINVRGFNQRNVAVMINGVPQNDMENGWVYWSNWDGVGDATSSIQMQRGLSAVNLATPSIGGTMNIITDPTALSKGGSFKQEAGAGSFLKTTFNYNTGLIADKYAFSSTIVRKTGEGIIDKTWTDAWAYYFGASYAMDSKNRFELYAIGAPQRHGQNLYKQNIGAYDEEFAKSIDGYDTNALVSVNPDGIDLNDDGDTYDSGESAKFDDTKGGRLFNQNWSPVDPSYTGQQYWYMYGDKTSDRHDPNFINERENFFHKPLVNLNHYLTINDQMRLSSILYWSGGSGGGTGTYGKIPTLDADGNLGDDDYKFYYGRSPWTRDWNTLIAYNSGDEDSVYVDKTLITREDGESVGILRNSINRQNTVGLISKLNYDFSDNLKLQFGLDWRTAGIEHAREVRDLMGGDYYVDYADDNYADGKEVGLGDIIAYHNSTTVDWFGVFGQGSYEDGPLSTYVMAGFSSIAYTYQDHFSIENEVIKSNSISTMQFKGGAMYDLNDNISAFANLGLVEKPPILDNVIYEDGTIADDPSNEKFESVELGVNYNSELFAVKANVYNTNWKDRNLTKSVTTGQGSSGDTDVIFLTGVNQTHKGFELEASSQVMDMLRVDASMSLGNWKFVDDANGDYQEAEYDTLGNVIGQMSTSYSYALEGLYVGDMPQTSFAVGATLTPMSGLSIQGLFNYYDNNYADWSPDSREIDGDDADREQVWMAPSYSKIDLHINYDLPMEVAGHNFQLFAHVFNLLDATYVQDAVDNSQYNSYGGTSHDADNAEVFLGTPRYFNLGLKVNF